MCDITHWFVWHDSFVCVTWLIYMCDMTHLYVWHDSHVNESCHTGRAHAGQWRTRSDDEQCHMLTESCHTNTWVMSHTWTSQVTHTNEACHIHERVMSHVWMSCLTGSHVSQRMSLWDMTHVSETWVMGHESCFTHSLWDTPSETWSPCVTWAPHAHTRWDVIACEWVMSRYHHVNESCLIIISHVNESCLIIISQGVRAHMMSCL